MVGSLQSDSPFHAHVIAKRDPAQCSGHMEATLPWARDYDTLNLRTALLKIIHFFHHLVRDFKAENEFSHFGTLHQATIQLLITI